MVTYRLTQISKLLSNIYNQWRDGARYLLIQTSEPLWRAHLGAKMMGDNKKDLLGVWLI